MKIEFCSDIACPFCYIGKRNLEEALARFAQAETVGLNFDFDKMKPTNTFDAHRLTKWAKIQGREADVVEKLLYTHFSKSKEIGNEEKI